MFDIEILGPNGIESAVLHLTVTSGPGSPVRIGMAPFYAALQQNASLRII